MNRKTRNQRKREKAKTAFMVAVMVVLMATVFTMMVKAWAEHPAEQPVNGYDYIESIKGGEY